MTSSMNNPAGACKRLFSALICLALFFISAKSNAQLHIIPQPVSAVQTGGIYKIKSSTVIAADKASMPVADYLQHYLWDTYKLKLKVVEGNGSGSIQLSVAPADTVTGSYQFNASSKNIQIHGNGAGLFYGVQTLIQLIENDKNGLTIPGCKINDYPRFGWRGLSMDVCRHFFIVDEVKRYIDMMAHYKLNVFHWHLTDDEGWRIQIDKYPLLTEVGSKIAYYAKIGKFRKLDNLNDGGRDGFYTKDDIRAIVKYAKDRFITVLPEIEMPGHSEAAIFAYPELGCKDTTGVLHRVRMLDPSEYTFNFYENVLTEVMQLFPNQYIHIGGDEAEMSDWLKSPTAVALMKREHLRDERQVQSYFIRRIETFLTSKGKKLVGWDEILKGGLAPSATVMSWEGEEGGIIAAKMHHDVIMTPLPQMYFDAPQAKAENEPVGWNDPVSWQMVYNYEPQSSQLTPEEAKYILGDQANIWVEKIGTMKHLEYMIYPRVLGVAELTWTPKNEKDIHRFEKSMYANYRLFNLWHLNARIPDVTGLEDVVTNKITYEQTLTYPLANAGMQYALTGQLPDANAAAKPFPLLISSPIKDTLIIRGFVTRPGSQRIIQSAMIRHVNIPQPEPALANLQNGLAYLAYKTTTYNYPTLDTGKTFVNGAFQDNIGIKPFPGMFNTWVKFSGYLQVDTEGDYRITSEFETTPLVLMGHIAILSSKDKYIEPQAAILHLQKGLYPLSGYYLANAVNSTKPLITIQSADGKTLNPNGHLFHE